MMYIVAHTPICAASSKTCMLMTGEILERTSLEMHLAKYVNYIYTVNFITFML